MSAKIKFGTDGWRGIIADDFTGTNVRLVAQATVNYLKDSNVPGDSIVVIGYDNRAQGEYFALETAKIAAQNGFRPVLSAALLVPGRFLSCEKAQRKGRCHDHRIAQPSVLQRI